MYTRAGIEERRARDDDWPRSAVCVNCGQPIARQEPGTPWVLKYRSVDERTAAFLALHPEVTIDYAGNRAQWLGDGELRRAQAPDSERLIEKLEDAFRLR